MAVKIGDTFRSSYADGNPLWKVVRRSGKSAVIAVSQVEMFEYEGRMVEGDYAGIEQAFTVKQVEATKRWESALSQMASDGDEFFASLKPGQIVHYCDGFSKFIRCEVVVEDGKNLCQPIALVGNFRPFDLPRRDALGNVYLDYHAKKIVNRTGAWQPNDSCVWESPTCSKSYKQVDPREMEAHDLSVPDMTPEQELDAKAEQLRQAMIEALQQPRDAREAIAAALRMVV